MVASVRQNSRTNGSRDQEHTRNNFGPIPFTCCDLIPIYLGMTNDDFLSRRPRTKRVFSDDDMARLRDRPLNPAGKSRRRLRRAGLDPVALDHRAGLAAAHRDRAAVTASVESEAGAAPHPPPL